MKVPSFVSQLFTLIRFMARRDRVRAPVWIVSVAGLIVLSAASFPTVYQDDASRLARAALMENPAVTIIAAPTGLDNYTFGAMLTTEMLPLTLATVALMSILLMTRHTRSDEAEGRIELTAAYTNTHRLFLLAAAIWVGFVNLLLGATMAIGLAALNLPSVSWQGSWMFGLATAGLGLVFVGIAAITAQLAQSPRGAAGIAGLALGGFYLLRVIGDSTGGSLSWLSPFGWAAEGQAYVDEQWWTLALPAAATLACTTAATVLVNRRDYDAGFIKPKAGRTGASHWLNGSLALILRLQRASVLAWVVGLSLFGAFYGSLAPEVEAFASEISAFTALTQADDLMGAFLGMVVAIFAITAASFGVTSLNRIKGEESSGRGEIVLATRVSPVRWLLLHALVAFVGSVVLLVVASLSMATTASVAIGDFNLFANLFSATLVYIPVLLLTVGLAAALYALRSNLIGLTWLMLAYSGIVWTFGVLFKLPDWVLQLSPFEHIPTLPIEEFKLAPLVVITAVGLTLALAGLILIRRRDISAGA